MVPFTFVGHARTRESFRAGWVSLLHVSDKSCSIPFSFGSLTWTTILFDTLDTKEDGKSFRQKITDVGIFAFTEAQEARWSYLLSLPTLGAMTSEAEHADYTHDALAKAKASWSVHCSTVNSRPD